MSSAMRMFVLGTLLGAAVAGAVIYATLTNSGETLSQGIQWWSRGESGVEFEVTGKDQMFFLAGLQREGVSGETPVDAHAGGRARYSSQDYREVVIFRAIPVGRLSERDLINVQCTPCILTPPPPPPPFNAEHWDNLTAMSSDHEQLFDAVGAAGR